MGFFLMNISKFVDDIIADKRTILHYVIKFVSDLRHQCFSPGIPVSSTNNTDHHDITETLLKVALNTITLTLMKGFDLLCLMHFQ
jgi:hypothetical protein